MLAKDMNNFELAFLDDNVQSIRIQLDAIGILDVVVDEKSVRQTGAELKADFTAQAELEGLDEVAVDLDECVVLSEHEFFLGFFLLRLFEHQLVAECFGGRCWCLTRSALRVRHIFNRLELLGGERRGLNVRRQRV